MATTRKRTRTGFNPSETEGVDTSTEMFEKFSKEEDAPSEEATSEEVFVPQEIIPTEDEGPRFVEPEPEPAPVATKVAPAPEAPKKRHPRNVPRFSTYK